MGSFGTRTGHWLGGSCFRVCSCDTPAPSLKISRATTEAVGESGGGTGSLGEDLRIASTSWRKTAVEGQNDEEDDDPYAPSFSSRSRMCFSAASYFVWTSRTCASRVSMASRFFFRDAAALSRLRTRRASFLQALSSALVMETPGSYRDSFLIPVMCGFFFLIDSNTPSSEEGSLAAAEDGKDDDDDDATTVGFGSSSRPTRGRLLFLQASCPGVAAAASSSEEEDDAETVEMERCLFRIAIRRFRAIAASLVAVVVAAVVSRSAVAMSKSVALQISWCCFGVVVCWVGKRLPSGSKRKL